MAHNYPHENKSCCILVCYRNNKVNYNGYSSFQVEVLCLQISRLLFQETVSQMQNMLDETQVWFK